MREMISELMIAESHNEKIKIEGLESLFVSCGLKVRKVREKMERKMTKDHLSER